MCRNSIEKGQSGYSSAPSQYTALFLKGWAGLFVISLIGAIVVTGGYILSNPFIPGDYFKIPLMALFIKNISCAVHPLFFSGHGSI